MRGWKSTISLIVLLGFINLRNESICRYGAKKMAVLSSTKLWVSFKSSVFWQYQYKKNQKSQSARTIWTCIWNNVLFQAGCASGSGMPAEEQSVAFMDFACFGCRYPSNYKDGVKTSVCYFKFLLKSLWNDFCCPFILYIICKMTLNINK